MSYNNIRGNSRELRDLLYNYTNVQRIYNNNMSEYNNNVTTLLRLMESPPRFRSPTFSRSTEEEHIANVLFQLSGQNQLNELRGVSDIEFDQNVSTIQYNNTLNDTMCPITHEDFEIDEEIYQINPCGHCFKKDALRRWLRSSRICPVCRNHVVQTDIENNRRNVDENSFSNRVLGNLMRSYTNGVAQMDGSNNMVYSFEIPLFDRH